MCKELISEALKENISLEIRENIQENALINILNGEKQKYEVSSSTDYNIKAIINEKTIYLNTNDISNSNRIINQIKKISKIIDKGNKSTLAKKQKIEQKNFKKPNIDFKKITKELLLLEKLKKEYKELTDLEIEFSYSYEKIEVLNNDLCITDENAIFNYGVELVVNKNGKNQTGWFYVTTKEIDFEKIKMKLKEKISEAIDKIDATSIKTGRYDIVLKNDSVFELMVNLIPLFTAENINKNLSCLNDKFNSKVFSEKLTLIEDPSNDKYPGKRLFDNEGTKTYYKEIIQNGIFKTKLYDNKNAVKDNVVSTGNSYGVRNLYIKPGNICLDKLIEKCSNGILIDLITGLHSGLNKLTGEFSLQAQGYLIQNGKKTKTLKSIILSSNIFELLNNIIEIGNDLEFNNIKGGCPSLLIRNIAISGNEEK